MATPKPQIGIGDIVSMRGVVNDVYEEAKMLRVVVLNEGKEETYGAVIVDADAVELIERKPQEPKRKKK